MGFLAPALPYLIPAGIGLASKLFGGDERKKTEYENIQDPREAAMRQAALQMAIKMMGMPMGDFSSYGSAASGIFGMTPSLPSWWNTGLQMPGMPGGNNPWSALNPRTQMPRRSLQAPAGGPPPGVPAPGNPNNLPVRG